MKFTVRCQEKNIMINQIESGEEDEEMKSYDFTMKTWRDDVTFLVEDQRFYATKAILAIASSVFEAMFGTNFRESEVKEIPLPGKKSEDFNEFLHCMYPNTQKKIDANNVYKILPLADEYNVKSLVKKCQRYLNFRLTNERASIKEVVHCHSLATKHNFQGLRDVCASRLSDIGLKEIQPTGLKDTETLLELHKDILKKQGELLDSARTELVKIYMHKDLTQETASAHDLTSSKGAMIAFSPCLDLTKEDLKRSKPVSVWDITFEVVVKVFNRNNVDCLSVLLSSTFPETEESLACIVDAKFQLRYMGEDDFEHKCSTIKKEFSKNAKFSHGTRLKLPELISYGYIVDNKIDCVVYFMVQKPFVKDQ
ncbi:uncharacterized protein LOC132744097 [Ruditapes philippinarum]|uniref:uncharacterized protein LOC132744097 n=1 Tax=Ruditapes philippinarum TaxID=129788 RepID=UPI00295A9B05|nr:uncharacterized protein LOC132744097 [Ruditapes philippinarum]